MKYIGALSGTSADGIDVALVEVKREVPKLIRADIFPYPVKITIRSTEDIVELDIKIGKLFAEAISNFLSREERKDIKAIGFHGQTIFHKGGKTLQIGEASFITQATGIPVVYDFRKADIAAGGEGAPLAPIVHYTLFAANETRLIVNIGGIANVTIIPKQADFSKVRGFDTGPGNIITDALARKAGLKFDKDGSIASRGKPSEKLLKKYLKHPFIKRSPPKSAGIEITKMKDSFLKEDLSLEDAMVTAVLLTVLAVKENTKELSLERVILCGGGARNPFMVETFREFFGNVIISDELGVNADFVEAILFAYLAHLFTERIKVDLGNITGSSRPILLGKLVLP